MKPNKAVRRALYTKAVYQWEREFLDLHPCMNADLPMSALQRLARRIWSVHGNGKMLPAVVSGCGLASDERRQSYYTIRIDNTEPRIVLARHQRRVGVLLHELAHALGTGREYDHGPAFTNRYFHLLGLYV